MDVGGPLIFHVLLSCWAGETQHDNGKVTGHFPGSGLAPVSVLGRHSEFPHGLVHASLSLS